MLFSDHNSCSEYNTKSQSSTIFFLFWLWKYKMYELLQTCKSYSARTVTEITKFWIFIAEYAIFSPRLLSNNSPENA